MFARPLVRSLPLIVVAWFVAAPSAALAQQEGAAEVLFREARAAMRKGDVARACPKFAESYRLDPSLGTLLNLALCEEQQGRIVSAWTKFKHFLDSAPLSDKRREIARERVAELEPR